MIKTSEISITFMFHGNIHIGKYFLPANILSIWSKGKLLFQIHELFISLFVNANVDARSH